MMFKKLLPLEIQKYLAMSKRQRQYELSLTLWYMPLVYIGVALLLVALTLYLDLRLEISNYVGSFFHAKAQPTRLLVSALIGGILTLSAFTLNSVLVVLTTFSGQFSPRMLLNFISDRITQHILGIFHGSFVYVLVVFLFITSKPEEYFVAVPSMTVLLAFLSAVTFIFFINHATSWMQVHNITYNMKNESKSIIKQSLKDELERYRVVKPGNMLEDYRNHEKLALSPQSGYVQWFNFRKMLEEARKDDIVIQLYNKVGDYTLKNNRLFSYWGPGAEQIDVAKYCSLIEIGYKETEIQDIKMGMNKLTEIAIKSLGNDDPKTTITTIHQMADLLLAVEGDITFTPYLADKNNQTRIVMASEDFNYYLYRGFGYIRHYAGDNYLIITEIILALSMIAQSINSDKLETIWEFSRNTIDHIPTEFIYDLDRDYLLEKLYHLALFTDHEEDYYTVERRLLKIEEQI
ncbi:DUF2254 domain-containing protein [Bacillus tianshenii]|nr:DUF2254 domain-containing protein [Bacillus tianshenii]